MFLPKLFLFILPFLWTVVESEKILFFFGLSTYSHRISVWPLAEKLAERGHDLTFIQPFKPKKPNPKIKEFSPKALEMVGTEFEKMDLLSIRLAGGREAIMEMNKDLPRFGVDVCKAFLTDETTENWIKNSKFDLIIIDALMNDCGFGLAHIFGAKTIIYGTTHPIGWWMDTFGIPVEASSIDDFFMPYRQPMNWHERAFTSLLTAGIYLQKQTSFYPQMDEMFKNHFKNSNFPPLAELERNTSLIFTNTHYSEEYSRSLPPFIVNVGGMHCEDSSQKLTKELETFINGSGDAGFIYISFGSAAKISSAPIEFQNIFYKALGNSKARFIWKFEGQRPKEMPQNVLIGSWMPQQAILAHPKIKGFLTHGGLLGIQEAVWHAVPLLPLPIFAEQDYNANRIQQTERGIMLDPNSLTIEKLEDAIHKLTTDSKYKRNMEKASRLFRDRPLKPVDDAVWWTEFVLRNSPEDLKALKPQGMRQTWYERRLLDVWAIIFSIIVTTIFLFIFISIKIIKFILSFKSTNSKIKKN